MNRWQKSFLTLCALLLISGGGIAVAQAPKEWRNTESQDKPLKDTVVKLEQKYTGTTPGSGNNLPRVEELRGKPGTWVTWPGFIMLDDGSSRLFLQTTVALQFDINEKKKTVTLRLKDAKVHLRNNRNPLVTTHFNTPLNRAYLKNRRGSLDLVLELRQSVSPRITQTTDSDGYQYLFIDFSAGQYPSPSPATQSSHETGAASSEESFESRDSLGTNDLDQ